MLQQIRLQFSTQNDPESRLIRAFTHGRFSHVDIVLKDDRLLGAHHRDGVQVRSPSYAAWSATKTIDLLVGNDSIVEKFYQCTLAQIGKPYDTEAILAFAFDRDWRDDDSWMCSELVAFGLETSGFFRRPLPDDIAKVTPADLLLVLSQFAVD